MTDSRARPIWLTEADLMTPLDSAFREIIRDKFNQAAAPATTATRPQPAGATTSVAPDSAETGATNTAARPIWITLEELVKACEGDTDTLLRLESRWDAAPADATEALRAKFLCEEDIDAVLAALGWTP